MEVMAVQHDVWNVLGDILLILALSGVIIPVLQRARISSVLGYLVCGLLIGPYSLGLFTQSMPWVSAFVITDTNLIVLLAELGVVFLLFMIGLELTFSRLWELRKFVLGLGSLQIAVTGLIIFAIAMQFGNNLPISILIGAAFSLSSTAIIMQLLTEMHMMSRPTGRICFSVLLMQDLAVVPILVLLSMFLGHTEGHFLLLLLKVLFSGVLVVVAIFVLGKLLLRPLLRILSPSKNAEWLLAVILFLVIGSSSLTYSFGLSAALGAFLAGLLIAETEYRHEIEVVIEPVKGILMGIFFLSVGMSIDVAAVLQYPFWLPASVIGIFVFKTMIFFPLALLFAIPKPQAAQAAVLLAQCGEFAFIIIGLAMVGGLLPEEHAQFFLLVAAVSLLVTPFTTRLAPLARRLVSSRVSEEEIDIPPSAFCGNHIIIAGFGRVGQMLAKILEDQTIPYVAIDSDRVHVSLLYAEGYPVVVGNAKYSELWRRLNVENAKAAVITIDEYSATGPILKALRRQWPLLPIIVRVMDTQNLSAYYDEGATVVVPETLESTLQLARILLEETGVDAYEADNIIDKHRQEALAGS